MQTTVSEPALIAGALDDQLASRLLYQRIIVLGSEVDDRVANRLCAQLLLLSAEDPRGIVDHIVERLDDVRPAVSKMAGL